MGFLIALLWVLLSLSTWGGRPAEAQLPGASAAVPATGGAHTALARGALAVGVNPAGLAMPGTPAWDVAAPGIRLRTGLSPVTLGDLGEFDGRTVPREVKLRWLERIEDAGGQRGSVGGEVTSLALSLGSWGLQLSTVAGGAAALTPGAAELLLFGNAGRTGEPRELDLQGSRLDFFVVTTLGIGRGWLLSRSDRGTFAAGATLGLSAGHALLVGRDAGSLVEDDPVELELDLPVVHQTADAPGVGRGWGMGLDLAGAWQKGPWSAGIAVKNLIHTFRWDTGELVFRPGQALFDVEDFDSDFDERAFREAPLGLRRRVDDLTFRPRVNLGVGYRVSPALTLTGEVQRRVGRAGLALRPRSRIAIGAEWAFRAVTLRAGAGYLTDGWTLGGGLELELGPARIAGAGVRQGGTDGDDTVWMLSLGFGPG